MDQGAILYPNEEASQTIARWNLCLSAKFLGLRPHLASLQEFLLWKWDIEGELVLIPRTNSSFLIQFLLEADLIRV